MGIDRFAVHNRPTFLPPSPTLFWPPTDVDKSVTLIRDLDQASQVARGGAISIGNFDGVHRGHAVLLKQLRQLADEVGGPAVVLTFDPHPASLLRPDQAPVPLTWIERRADLLYRLGVDRVIACRPTAELLGLSATDFFQQVIRERLDCQAMAEGPNFYFGKDRQGDVEMLGQLCQRAAIPLRIVEPLDNQGQMVSSTMVRAAIAEGQIEAANAMLTAPYRISGLVAVGSQRGAGLGFPTANLSDLKVLAPAAGVYAGKTWVGGTAYRAAIHIGPNLTFDEGQCKVEVHLLDFTGDLYGERLEVQFNRRVRGIVKFASVDDLRNQLGRDIATVRNEPLS